MAKKRTAPPLPQAGDAFLMPLLDGRFGVCRVLWASTPEQARTYGAPHALVAGSPWIGTAAPDLREPALREIQQLTHHAWNGQLNMNVVTAPPPAEFRKLGVIEPTAAEQALKCPASGGWSFAGPLWMQWRWDHDREAVLREDAERAAAQARAYKEAERQRQAARGALTLEALRKRRRFTDWGGFAPAAAVRKCRRVFRETAERLLALGAKPGKRAVLAVLKECVERLNALDEQYEHFIETTTAEEVSGEIDDLAQASGLREENVADRWRAW